MWIVKSKEDLVWLAGVGLLGASLASQAKFGPNNLQPTPGLLSMSMLRREIDFKGIAGVMKDNFLDVLVLPIGMVSFCCGLAWPATGFAWISEAQARPRGPRTSVNAWCCNFHGLGEWFLRNHLVEIKPTKKKMQSEPKFNEPGKWLIYLNKLVRYLAWPGNLSPEHRSQSLRTGLAWLGLTSLASLELPNDGRYLFSSDMRFSKTQSSVSTFVLVPAPNTTFPPDVFIGQADELSTNWTESF
ncbi:hypothetical protein B0H13DRAFT_1884768 [Mycena leptocephala]|nr:hypothetical protein B0H13DRAFT_1884768 [Mycena leptocephala]